VGNVFSKLVDGINLKEGQQIPEAELSDTEILVDESNIDEAARKLGALRQLQEQDVNLRNEKKLHGGQSMIQRILLPPPKRV
jgi:hypothetical protein